MINQTDYEPFGATVAVTGIDTRKKFIDKEKDRETGTANHGVRQYDPEGPGFASVDPLWEKYPAWTPYHYGFNNPLGTKDPSGLDTTVGDAILDGLGDALDGIIYVLTSPTRPMVSDESPPPTLEGLGRMWNTAMGEYGTYAQTRLLVGVGAETAFWASLGGIEGAFARVARVETAVLVNAENLKLSQTVANHLKDVVKSGANKGKLARPYLNSTLATREIMAAKPPIPDPGGVAGALRWDVPGMFRGSSGTWELVVDTKTKTILHYNFVTGR